MTKSAWLNALQEECKRTSQRKAADRLGVSPAVINQVLAGKYQGDMERIRQLVEGELLGACVNCPVLGDIKVSACMAHQQRRNVSTNPTYIQLYKACRSGCPYSQLTDTLKKPMRFSQELEIPAVKLYDADGVIRRLTMQAEDEGKQKNAALAGLLSKELQSLAFKYNKLLKEKHAGEQRGS